MHFDIFCTVIDNFGDIGVTWRLARQLSAEHHIKVRLWVDDLTAFQRIRPQVRPDLDSQSLYGVEIRRWTDPLPDIAPGEVVVEALACNLPEDFITRMAEREPKPLWLNLEYLTAEAWADGVHGLPSPHPRLPLLKYFFVPGFSEKTGGLTREAGLIQEREAFQEDIQAQDTYWRGHGLPPKADNELRVSLFAYENDALPGLLDALSTSHQPVTLLIPEGKALPQVAAWLGTHDLAAGSTRISGRLKVCVLPMLDQDSYDRLLWACDLNFVRGEDSFLRAQYAARPMLWQAYRQEERAHFAKLDAFLDRYCESMASTLSESTHALWHAWNEEQDISSLWPGYLSQRLDLNSHARLWCEHLARQQDLASKLMIFCEKFVKKS